MHVNTCSFFLSEMWPLTNDLARASYPVLSSGLELIAVVFMEPELLPGPVLRDLCS